MAGRKPFGAQQGNVLAGELQQVGLFTGLGPLGDDDNLAVGFCGHNFFSLMRKRGYQKAGAKRQMENARVIAATATMTFAFPICMKRVILS
jgi:hypothetical protein